MSVGSPSSAIGGAAGTAASRVSGCAPASLPLVSVCISAYNVERFLRQSLGSVLAQTYPNFEVILIDNGSTDRTFDVARSLADDRVRCFRVPHNLGGYQAMNKIASMARGEIVAIYHSDDYYQPEIIAKEAAYLRAHPDVGAVFCLQHYIDENGRIFGGASLPREFLGKESLGYKEIFRYILRNKNTLLCCPTFMVRKSVFDAVGPFDPETFNIACDNEMWLRIAKQFPIAILNERLMGYRVGEWQWTARYRRLRTEPDWHFAVMDHFLAKDNWLNELSADDLAEYEFHRCDDNTFRAVNHLILGEKDRARELLKRPFPWRTFQNGIRRRKLRLLVLRAIVKSGLAIGVTRAMVPFLRRIGP